MSSGPAYGVSSRARPDRLSWPRVLVRMLLVVLPGQLLGNFLVDRRPERERRAARPARPGRCWRWSPPGCSPGSVWGSCCGRSGTSLSRTPWPGPASAIAVFVLLLGLAQLRLPAITPGASFGDFLPGALIVAVVQTAVALPLWWWRAAAV